MHEDGPHDNEFNERIMRDLTSRGEVLSIPVERKSIFENGRSFAAFVHVFPSQWLMYSVIEKKKKKIANSIYFRQS